jgi:hypothetical protein
MRLNVRVSIILENISTASFDLSHRPWVKYQTGYRKMLGLYPSPRLMILSCKSFVLAKTGIVNGHSNCRHVITWIDKRIVHSI